MLPHSMHRNEEAVEIREKRFGYFPKVFRWHGKVYNVEAIEGCWTVVRRAPRHCFRVRCADGRFDLFQDARDDIWCLSPVRA